MSGAEIREGVKIFMEISSLGNGYMRIIGPWNLSKKNDEKYDLIKAETVFYIFKQFSKISSNFG